MEHEQIWEINQGCFRNGGSNLWTENIVMLQNHLYSWRDHALSIVALSLSPTSSIVLGSGEGIVKNLTDCGPGRWLELK